MIVWHTVYRAKILYLRSCNQIITIQRFSLRILTAQERRFFAQVQVPLHGHGIVHIFVHRGVSQKGVYGNQETGRKDGPPENIRKQVHQQKDGNSTHAKDSGFLWNGNACDNNDREAVHARVSCLAVSHVGTIETMA